MEESDNVSADEADNVDTRVRELKKLVEAEKQHTTIGAPNEIARQPKIQKVPFIISDRKDFYKYYVPRVASIDPAYHCHELNLCLAQKYKRKLAAVFIKASCQETEALYNIVNNRIKELKGYYDEDVLKEYDDKTLSWILFLEGCSILMFTCGFIHGQLKDFKIKTDLSAFTQHDLFLLQNQIPFQVLRLLMNATPCGFAKKKKKKKKKSIELFIPANVMAPVECKKNLSFDMDKLDAIHLLDLLQQVAVQLEGPLISNNKKFKIRPREFQVCFKDITFSSFWFTGLLQLPPLIVYESCPDNFRTNYKLTSYISSWIQSSKAHFDMFML